MELKYIVKDFKYKTVKDLLVKNFNISNRLILKLKTNGKICVNNFKVFSNCMLFIGDVVKIDLTFEENNFYERRRGKY
jgi:hypothetical protein